MQLASERVGQVRFATFAIPIALYACAVLVRVWAVAQVHFPLTEGSAYYVGVARNLVGGRGLVIDTLWSYSTPPLTLPRPAFELWQPMASLLAAAPMAVLGPTFGAAQLGAALVGSLLAPLAWLVARDTAARLALPASRGSAVALGAGLITAVFGPFLLAAAVPDSALPFTLFAVSACVVMPAALAGDRRAILALGVLLGLAYLTRLDAIYLGLTLLILAGVLRLGLRRTAQLVPAVVAIGALVALPWWARNLQAFGSALPGQISDNLFLTANEQIFGYLERPTLDAFLAQGPLNIAANVLHAAGHNLYDVLIVPGAPVILPGLLAIGVFMGRRRTIRSPIGSSALAALLITGGLTFAFTSVLFPIATLWGTFEHAAGPLLIGLIVTAVVGTDALVAWIGARRGWQRNNAWIAPFALLVMVVPLGAVQIGLAGRQAADEQQLFDDLAVSLPPALQGAGVADGTPIVTDRPIWLSDALGRPTLALPDEAPSSVVQLASDFGAHAVVVIKERGRYPDALSAGSGECFDPLWPGVPPEAVALFVINPGCAP